MKSIRIPILPLLLGVLALGFFLFQRELSSGRVLAAPGSEGNSLASHGEGLSPGGDLAGDGVEQGTGSARQEVELPPLEPEEEEPAAKAPEPEHNTRLFGLVERPGGAPISGARVLIRRSSPWFTPPADAEPLMAMGTPNPAFEGECDGEGRFLLYDVPPGKYSVSINAERFAPLGRHGIEVPVHEDYDLGSFRMEEGVRLEGRVLGSKGEGLEGVQVLSAITKEAGHTRLELPGFGVPLTQSDPEGAFVLTSVAPGSWHLIFDAPGYRISELTGSTEPAGQVDRSLLVHLDPGQSIQGTVSGLDPVTEGPLRVSARCMKEQATAAASDLTETEKLRSRHALVQADGTFEVGGLVPGVKYHLMLYRQKKPRTEEPAAGEQVQELWTPVKGVDPVQELPGPVPVEFKFREEAAILLTALDESNDKPIDRFRVHVTGENLSGAGLLKDEAGETRTNFPGGVARFEGLLPQELGSSTTVRVRADGYGDYIKKNLMLRPGEELTLEDVRLQPAPMGEVLVVDKDTGEPIPNARVAVSKAVDSKHIAGALRAEGDLPEPTDTLRFATCDGRGVARLTLWEGTLCSVGAVAEGYQKGEPKTTAPPFEEQARLELVRGGQVTVRVVDDLGAPVAGMYVQHSIDGKTQRNHHYWAPDQGLESKTGEDGLVVFENLPLGKHTFEVLETQNRYGRGGEDAGFEAKGDVYLEHGEFEELELRVAARGQLSVTLLQQGVPLEGALVKISPLDGQPSRSNFWFGGQTQDPRTQISDYAGRANFRGIKVGEYLLRVAHGDRRMVARREVRVTRRPGELELELGLAVIEGQVTDPAGQPIEGVNMAVSAVDRSLHDRDMNDYRVSISEDEKGNASYDYESIKAWNIRTDSDGRYELLGVASETELQVRASSRYVVGESRKVGPLGAQEYVSPFDFVLERAGVITMKLSGVSRANREEYSFKLVRIEGEKELETQTRSMRKWRSSLVLESMRPGTWRVQLLHRDAAAPLDERSVEVRIGKTTGITFRP